MRTLPAFSVDQLFDALEQYKFFRILFGGLYAKLDGVWSSCTVFMVAADGSRYLAIGDKSFHESFFGVQIEEWI